MNPVSAKKTIESGRADSAWFFITVLFFTCLISISGYFLIQQQQRFLLKEKHKEIATIADLKSAQLVQWRNERFAEGASIRANAMMARRIKDYLAGKDRPSVQQEFKLWMANLIDLGGYSRGMLFTPDGDLISSDAELKPSLTQHYFSMVAEASGEHELILSDFHTDGTGTPFDIDLVVPIMDFSRTPHRCIAVLILDIEPEKRLYPLLQSWPTTSTSAETILVRKDGDSVLFLNDLRYRKQTNEPFYLPITHTNLPAVRAALGEEGSFDGVDYRDIAVISATRKIPGTQWGMVAKIDRAEVLAPLTKFTFYVILSGLFITAALILGVFLWSGRRKAETLRNQVEMQKRNEAELQAIHAQLEQQILERTRDLYDINTILRQEIDEREQLEQQLLNAKRLEAIGQIAGGVAHEVRNPLNAILTITEALFREKEIENNPEYEPYIQHIRTQVTRLVHLMNDLLDLGRTIPQNNLQPMPLCTICRETLTLWKASGISGNKQVELTSAHDETACTVLVDGLKLQQVFFNLLENAGHHTPEGSTIEMKLLHPADGMAVVQIIDTGTGIAEDKLTHVFDPFYTGRKGGTGLGLALVRHFTENMGGTVQIWNNNPSPGCTAEVRIPLHREEKR